MRSARPTLMQSTLICIAFSLFLLSTRFLNTAFYPAMSSIFPLSRDISMLFGTASMLVGFFLAMNKPARFLGRQSMVLLFAFSVLSMLTCLIAIRLSNPIFLTLASCLTTFFRLLTWISLGLALSTIPKRYCLGVLAAAYLLKNIGAATTNSLDGDVQTALLLFSGSVPCLIIRRSLVPLFERIKYDESPAILAITNPRSFIAPTNRIFLAALFFQIVLGFALTFESIDGQPTYTVASIALIASIVVLRINSIDSLFNLAFFIALAGLLLSSCLDRPFWQTLTAVGSVANSLTAAGSDTFCIAIWYTLARIGQKSPNAALPTFFFWESIDTLGTATGATLGLFTNELVHSGESGVATLFILTVAFVFTIFNFVMLRQFNFDDTISSLSGIEETLSRCSSPQPAEPTSGKAILLNEPFTAEHTLIEHHDPCSYIAETYRLTPRETEVLRFLAHGRNVPFIEEKLVISRNTIKKHVASIYAKTDVHSQQELINLVDASRIQHADRNCN